MPSSSEPAARMQPDANARLRDIPSVDELLGRSRIAALMQTAGRNLVTEATRAVLADVRTRLKNAAQETGSEAASATPEDLESRVIAEVEALLTPSLRRAINATGVILHTNLGRAPLSSAAIARIAATAGGYSNLEYDLESGQRGKRDVHTARLLAEIAGAESAIVVNNNAAAVFLVLNTLAKGDEVIVSRGELIEIGDGFRIPDIMAESGAILREVGTTNRTRIRDYERAITERTRLLLRVHPSNFRIAGFTEKPSLEELVALGRRAQIPVFEDLGSGCLADLSASGVCEPLARESSRAGVSVVSFSGDKLLGGPQAGVIAGKKDLVERVRRNPLFRALRVDKLTIAALEGTLQSYQRGALDEIPSLRMIRLSADDMSARAEQFAEKIRHELARDAAVDVREGFSVIGGGSTPDQQLPTYVVSIASRRHSAAALEERLRLPAAAEKSASLPSIIARIEEDRVVFDLRTVFPEEESALAAAIISAARA
ncbi:MAG TPA: L-seryl-tRNA(Sec) selenium transferase [Candidatus Dormibacteraeota bacterium]|nr:L-seryl-tRNA(Sec) selenium transferase [Candidatus Dormibacteraeota bacterium]